MNSENPGTDDRQDRRRRDFGRRSVTRALCQSGKTWYGKMHLARGAQVGEGVVAVRCGAVLATEILPTRQVQRQRRMQMMIGGKG